MLPPQQARDDSLRARLAQGRDAVTRASEFRACCGGSITRSEEHTSELQSDQISYAVFCLKKKKTGQARQVAQPGQGGDQRSLSDLTRGARAEIGRAHVCTPVTATSRMPSGA